MKTGGFGNPVRGTGGFMALLRRIARSIIDAEGAGDVSDEDR